MKEEEITEEFSLRFAQSCSFLSLWWIVWSNFSLLPPVAVAEKRLMDVKLGELGSWLGARDFTPNGIISAVRRGEDTSSLRSSAH